MTLPWKTSRSTGPTSVTWRHTHEQLQQLMTASPVQSLVMGRCVEYSEMRSILSDPKFSRYFPLLELLNCVFFLGLIVLSWWYLAIVLTFACSAADLLLNAGTNFREMRATTSNMDNVTRSFVFASQFAHTLFPNYLQPCVGAMSTGDGFSHFWRRNGKFCVIVCSATRTTGIYWLRSVEGTDRWFWPAIYWV